MIRQVISTFPQGELNGSSEKRGLPLIAAIRYRYPEAVTGLLEAGCNPDIASKAKCDGYRSAYSYAKTFFLDEYIALMEPYHIEQSNYYRRDYYDERDDFDAFGDNEFLFGEDDSWDILENMKNEDDIPCQL